jgi:hypothetical protein
MCGPRRMSGGVEPNTFNLGVWEGEGSARRWSQGGVGSLAWVGVAAFGLAGVGPATSATSIVLSFVLE